MAEFRLPVDPVTLAIDEGPWTGVEIEVDRAAPPLVRYSLIGLMQTPERETDKQKDARGRELFALLETEIVIGWNVANKRGTPIPPTAEGFVRVPPDLIATVIGYFLTLTAP